MAKGIHKGTEFNNIQETWNQNERAGTGSNAPGQPTSAPSNTGKDDLDRVIEQEATEYDSANKEDQLLSGDRASVNDDD